MTQDSQDQTIQANDKNFQEWGRQVQKEVSREMENRFTSASKTSLSREDVTRAVEQIDFTNLIRDVVSGTRREQPSARA